LFRVRLAHCPANGSRSGFSRQAGNIYPDLRGLGVADFRALLLLSEHTVVPAE
jgi:hypothetical protein